MLKYVVFATLLLSTLLSMPTSGMATEPLGATVLSDCPIDSSLCNAVRGTVALGRWYDLANNLSMSTDAGDPISPSGVVNFTLPYTGPCAPGIGIFAPCAAGGGQFGYIGAQAHRELYVRASFWISPGYGCSSVGSSKTIFLRTFDNLAGFAQTNGVWMIQGCGATKTLTFAHNTGGLNNSHICTGSTGEICFPNQGSGAVNEGQWHTIEYWVRSSSTTTARDGCVAWALNGVMAGKYTTLNYGSGNVNEVVLNTTWDGYGNGQGFNTTVTQRWGHLRVLSAPSGSCAAATTSGTQPNPDTPTGPPAAPTGLNAQKVVQ